MFKTDLKPILHCLDKYEAWTLLNYSHDIFRTHTLSYDRATVYIYIFWLIEACIHNFNFISALIYELIFLCSVLKTIKTISAGKCYLLGIFQFKWFYNCKKIQLETVTDGVSRTYKNIKNSGLNSVYRIKQCQCLSLKPGSFSINCAWSEDTLCIYRQE